MSRHILSLLPGQLTAFDLDAFVVHAERLNQHYRNTCTTPFPKAPSRWLSHYEFAPHAIAFTSEGDIDGGLSWLIGATVDFSFTRALCAPHYGARGGRCYDPASLILLEVMSGVGLTLAAKVDQYILSTDGQLEPTYSRDKGCTYACQDCRAFTLSETDRQALGAQLQRGAKRRQLTCPFPEVVAKVHEASAKHGAPKDPMVTLLEGNCPHVN